MKKGFTKTYAVVCIGLILLSMAVYKEHRHIYLQSASVDSAKSGVVCSIDTNSAYLMMWQKLFLTRDQIREEYYNNHIALVSGVNPA